MNGSKFTHKDDAEIIRMKAMDCTDREIGQAIGRSIRAVESRYRVLRMLASGRQRLDCMPEPGGMPPFEDDPRALKDSGSPGPLPPRDATPMLTQIMTAD